MRPKLIALIAASAVALVGCTAVETSADIQIEPSATAKPVVETEIADEPIGVVADYSELGISPEEYAFTIYAHGQIAGSKVELPNIPEVVDALHNYCDDGEPFDISNERDINESLTKVADAQACNEIEGQR